MRWHWIALGYVTYLALASLTRREFAPARRPLLATAALAWAMLAIAATSIRADLAIAPIVVVLLPAIVLLCGYWLSGCFFVRRDTRLEAWLLASDVALLERTGVLAWFRRAPRAITEYFELSYLLVYVAVPAGAVTLALGGHLDRVPHFWSVVLLAEFACYGMLPWMQTRPPRVLEKAPAGAKAAAVRRLNLGVVNRASIQANTIPSGHAAGAIATALAVGSVMPIAGALFLVAAISIAIATVLGRYHYGVDSILGAIVAIAAWIIL